MLTPDAENAREVERIHAARAAETKRKREEALERRGQCSCGGGCGTVYRLKDGEPVDSNSLRDPEVDKALRDLFIGLAIAAAYMTVLLVLLVVL